MNWQRTLSQLDIGESIQREGVAVGRLSRNRFVILTGGQVFDVGGNRATVGYVISQACAVLGQPIPAPCADCGAPRETRSYCNPCASRRIQGYKRAS